MTYPAAHKVPAAPKGKEWFLVEEGDIKEGYIKEGDWLGCIQQKAAGAIGGMVGGWAVYRLRPKTRYFTHATKFGDTTSYIRYVGEKGTIVRTDGTESEQRPVDLATAVELSKEGDWKEIAAKEALALTKPKNEVALLRAEVAALKAENARLLAKEKVCIASIVDLQNKLAAARAAVETLKSL